MKREIIITVITILIIIFGDIVTQNYTKKCVKETNDSLIDLKQKILNKKENNKDDLKSYSEYIYTNWRNNTKGLAYYIEHNELEKIDIQIQIITADLEAETSEDAISEIEQAIYLLHHIEEKRAFKLKNVF